MLTTKRIPVPDWARPFAILREQEFGEQEFSRCSSHHDEVLEAVQEAVQQYVNDDENVFSKEQGHFPQRDRLTGEYYIGSETYDVYEEQRYPHEELGQRAERKYRLSVEVRCLEKQWISHQTDFDYLGLEVIFWWEPEDGKFRYIGDVEPSSI